MACAALGALLGTVRSATGSEVAYHFDRNALAATARASDGTYVALTDSGNLLAFDPATYALLAERVPWSPATCLSATAGGVVAGLDDGRIVSVDVPSLKMQRIGAVDGHPAWIGRRRSGALLVAHGFAPDRPFGWGPRGLASLIVEELGTARSLRIPFVATTFLVDSRDRLWLGADHGEWGGRLAVVDLEKWTMRELKDSLPGVYGIVETIEGRIWVHGGTMHMGTHNAFVRVVDGTSQKTLFETGIVDKRRSDRPTFPVTHLVPLRGRGFLAFSYDQVFEVDSKLSRWRRLPDFKARYHWGRPDAVGSYPAARSIYVIGESPLHVLISTALDGWVELRGGRYLPHRVAGQLAATNVREVADWAGKLVAHGEGESFVLEPDGWHLVDASSPVPLPEVARQKERPERALHLASDGKLVAIFRNQPESWNDDRAHLLVVAECAAGTCRSLGQETTKLAPDDTFLTPDDALWAIDERGLWSFREGRWSIVLAGSAPRAGLGPGVRVVFTRTQPWLLAGRDGAKLFWPGDRRTAPHFAGVTGIEDMMQDPPDHDLIECAGRIYIAIADKVCALDDQGRCAPLAIKGIQWPRRLGCDRRDRPWLGGYGIWRLEGDVAIPVHDLDGLLGGRETLALGRDSGAGLAVVIQGRGVAVLDPAQPTPPGATRDLDEADRPRGDHVRQAVALWIDLDKPWPLLEELDVTLRSAGAGGYGGIRATGYRSPWFFEFFGRDARRLVEIIRPRVEKEGRRALLMRRDGEIGAPVTRIEIRPPAPTSPDAGSPDVPSTGR